MSGTAFGPSSGGGVTGPSHVTGGADREHVTSDTTTGHTRAFRQVGQAPFVLLCTYRRSGVGVATVVWVAAEGDRLVVTTPVGSGKVKRLRRDPRVLLLPSGRLGRVSDGSPVVHATASVLGPDGDHPGAVAALRTKYGWQYRAVLAVESWVRRRRGHDAGRLIIAVNPPAGTET